MGPAADGPSPGRTRPRRAVAAAVLLLTVVAGIVVWALARDDRAVTPIERDLERLASTDGLYTAPQIRALAGFALDQTAFAWAALTGLDARPSARPTPGTVARLRAGDLDTAARRTAYRTMLADAGVGERPSASTVGRALAGSWPGDDEERLLHASAVVTVARGADLPAARLNDGVRRRLEATWRSAAALDEPVYGTHRARIGAYLGRRPDGALRRLAATLPAPDPQAEPRAMRAAAVVELAAAAGTATPAGAAETALRAARSSPTPEVVHALVTAWRAAERPTAELAALAAPLRRDLGPGGAVRENAVFPAIAKAAWFVVHLRLAVGAPALPESRMVRLSQVMAQRVRDQEIDADDFALLLATARLAGLDYDAPGVPDAEAPAARVGDPRGALIWSQRARVAADRDGSPVDVEVTPWRARDGATIGAVGALRWSAERVGARLRAPAAWTAEVDRRAAGTRFGSVRWALQAAAGAAASGREDVADRIVRGAVRLGCPGFPRLVVDRDGQCDLESTLLLLELRDRVPAARRLAEPLT